MARQAMFDGLVYDENENPVAAAFIGGEAHYIVDDDGFLRHIDAEFVDRQVLAVILDQLAENKDMAVEQAMAMMGQDDLLTKAAIDASLRNISADQIIEQGVPAQARDMLGMFGFRIIIDLHGEVVRLDQPAAPEEGE
ncbi:MAG: hypothetical protein KJ046_09115 [Anaerolineae bacterium]|nr:hypothetical protein [Anaerolineae bacterium]RIK22943.1 MAG: hypothetical protein DCC51_04295 [Anaerolineae bacterium]